MLRVLASQRMFKPAVVPMRRPWPGAGRRGSGLPGRARAGACRRQGPRLRADPGLLQRAAAARQLLEQVAAAAVLHDEADVLRVADHRVQLHLPPRPARGVGSAAPALGCRPAWLPEHIREHFGYLRLAHAGVAGPGAGQGGSSVGVRTAPACWLRWPACARAAAACARPAAPLALAGRSDARAGACHALIAAELEHYVDLAPQARVVLGLHARALVRLDDHRLARGLAGRARHDRHAARAPAALELCASAACARRVRNLHSLPSASLRRAACWRRTLRAHESQELPCREAASRCRTCPCTAPRGCQTGSCWCTPRPCCPPPSAAAARCAQGRSASPQQRTPPPPQRPANPGSCRPRGGQGAPQRPAGPALEQCGPSLQAVSRPATHGTSEPQRHLHGLNKDSDAGRKPLRRWRAEVRAAREDGATLGSPDAPVKGGVARVEKGQVPG
jgi:hypothetical protein